MFCATEVVWLLISRHYCGNRELIQNQSSERLQLKYTKIRHDSLPALQYLFIENFQGLP